LFWAVLFTLGCGLLGVIIGKCYYDNPITKRAFQDMKKKFDSMQ